MAKHNEFPIRGIPVIEGIYLETIGAYAVAVRNREGDMSVQTEVRPYTLRDRLANIPIARSLVRPFFSLSRFFDALQMSESLKPRYGDRGTRFEAGFAKLFRIPPERHVGRLSGIAMLIVFALLMIGLPYGAQRFLQTEPWSTAPILTAITTALRVTGFLMTVRLCASLRVLRRLGKERAALGKLINAYEIYGTHLTREEVEMTSSVTNHSNGVYLILTVCATMIGCAFLPVHSMAVTVLWRIGVFLAASVVVGELLTPIENSPQRSFLALLRVPLMQIQRLYLTKPDDSMLDLSVCVYEALRHTAYGDLNDD